MIYKLSKDSDSLLHSPCVNFPFNDPPVDPVEFADNLKETMVARRGIGLSANQVGFPYRVFVAGDYNDPSKVTAFFNPRVVFESEEEQLIEEGCLSYPGLFIKIKRPAMVRIRYAGPNGQMNTAMFDGIAARVILHEYDHMEGITFHQRASTLRLQQAKKQKVKLDKMRERNLRGKVA